MQIVELTASNVKRLKAVKITPRGAVINIGGQNAQGKSSVLDSIQMALGGEPQETMPVRQGEEKATIVVNLGDLIVRRTITATGVPLELCGHMNRRSYRQQWLRDAAEE